MQLLLIFACIAIGIVLTNCASSDAHKPDPTRQPWRDSWAAMPTAKASEADGLHRSFQAAQDQVSLPYVNGGEDAEGISENLHGILKTIGDQVFSEALLRENPKTRAAVRDCMFESEVKKDFPMTHKVLTQAPLLRWPSDLAYEQGWAEAGQIAPAKEKWTE